MSTPNRQKGMVKPFGSKDFFTAMIPTFESVQAATNQMQAASEQVIAASEQVISAGPFSSNLKPFALHSVTPPLMAAAAGSAFAMGVAGQMFGLMFGTMTAASKLTNPFTFEWSFSDGADYGSTPVTQSVKTKKVTAPKIMAAKPRLNKSDVDPLPENKPTIATKIAMSVKPDAAKQTPMPKEFIKPPALAKPVSPDDLKLISGVGPKLEKVLNSLGIWTFAQVESWSINEVAWVDDYLQFKGRIDRDGWLAQSAKLASGK